MKEQYYYSAKNNAFYPESLKSEYEASGNGWPDDAIKISYKTYSNLLSGQSEGKIITSGKGGKPVLITPAVDWTCVAEGERERRLTEANNTISDWRTELMLGVINDDDKNRLILWMQYIKLLKTLDFSAIADESGYSGIQWPVQPKK